MFSIEYFSETRDSIFKIKAFIVNRQIEFILI